MRDRMMGGEFIILILFIETLRMRERKLEKKIAVFKKTNGKSIEHSQLWRMG